MSDVDCNDGDALVNPSVVEVCDGRDNNCDGLKDEVSIETADSRMQGWVGLKDFGGRVAGAGDLNGDGIVDLSFVEQGAPEKDGIISMLTSPFQRGDALIAPTGEVVVAYGASDSSVPPSVVSDADITGDGIFDLIVGDVATGHPYGVGAVFVFPGPSTPNATADEAPIVMLGSTANFGRIVAGGGDADGDGYDDLLVSEGQSNGWKFNIVRGPVSLGDSIAAPSVTVSSDANEFFGGPLAFAGDVNGDGAEDIVAATSSSSSDIGLQIRIWSGPFHTDTTAVKAQASIAAPVFTYFYDVSTGGDVNGDGYSDVVLSTYFRQDEDIPGAVYIFHGPLVGALHLEDADSILEGPPSAWSAGSSVFAREDLNGDGLDDIITGDMWHASPPDHDGSGEAYGAVYVSFAPFVGTQRLAEADIVVVGTRAWGLDAVFALSPGNLGGGPGPDLLIGAPNWAANEADQDSHYSVPGAAFIFLDPRPCQPSAQD